MALFKNTQQTDTPVSLPCYHCWAISDRINLYKNTEDAPITLGKKIFHCIKRFTLEAEPKCRECYRDMTKECFYIDKQYYNPELIDILIKVYSDRARKRVGSTAIFWDDEYYNAIIKALAKEKPKTKPKQDYFQRLEEREDKIF